MIEKAFEVLFAVETDKSYNLISILAQKNINISLRNSESILSLIHNRSTGTFLEYLDLLSREKFIFIPGIYITNELHRIEEVNFLIFEKDDRLLMSAFSSNSLEHHSNFLNTNNEQSRVPSEKISGNTNTKSQSDSLTQLSIELNNARIELYKKNQIILDVLKSKEETKKKLEALNGMKDQLFSIIAHDLRNPLNSIKNILELMENKQDFTIIEKSYIIRNLCSEVRSSVDLMDNLFEWVAQNKDGINIIFENTDIRMLANEEIKRLSVALQNKEIDIQIDYETDKNAYVEVHSITTVIRNLIYNAIKFTPQNGMIIVRIQEEDSMIRLSVIDSGVGMSSEKLEKLFRNDSSIRTCGTNGEIGTGFGLTICREMVERNFGKIFVKSEVGEGSEFSFTIPMAKI